MPEGDVIIYQSLRQIIWSLEPGPQLVPAEHVWKHPLPPDQTSATPNPRENPQSSCTAPLCFRIASLFPWKGRGSLVGGRHPGEEGCRDF